MKILMINPPFLPKYSRSSRSPAVTKSGTIYYPLWLSYATGVLGKGGHEVMLIDCPAEGLELKDIQERVTRFQPQMAVFDTTTPSIYSDVEALVTVKGWLSEEVVTVLVGTHPTALPEETIALADEIDLIARREYDFTLLDLANRWDAGEFKFSDVLGLSFRAEGGVVHNPDRPYCENLDDLPFVSEVYKRHLNINNYFYAHTKNPVISFFAGRGCPNRCFFCVYPQTMFGHRYRHRSPESIVGELEYIAREFPEVKEVLIDDDNFTVDQDHVLKVCELIMKRGLKVTWTVEARVNLKLDVMKAMKKAGCRLLVAGFESGDQRILDNISKGITIAQTEEFCRNAKKAGLRVHGCFMVGNMGETRETMETTLRFAQRLNPDTAQFFPLMVYPGTKAYDWASSNSFIKAESFRDWLTETGMHNCVLNTDQLAASELVEFCDEARRRFYLRPSYLIRKSLDLLKHPSEIRRTVKAGSTFFWHLLGRRKAC